MSENNKSFAERYASKKSSFTSQNLQQKSDFSSSVEQKSNIVDVKEDLSEKNKLNSKVDIKKKMQADLIYLVKGVDAGRNAWYYVLVDRLKVQTFLKALNDDIIHLENYGKILYSAYGDEPPQDITDSLKEEYGI
jgi:hypothetical protein